MIKKLMKSVREYKKPMTMAPVYVIVESVFDIIIPTVMALLIDRGIGQGNMNEIIFYGVILAVMAFITLIIGNRAGKSAAVASSGFAKNLRFDMFEKIQSYSFSNIDKFSTSSIITRLTTDVTNVQNAFQMIIRLGFRAPAMILFALIFSFRINAKISLIFLGVIPVLAIGLYLTVAHVHPIFVRAFQKYDKLNNVVQENLHGIRVVKSYNRQAHEESKFATISKQIFNDFTRAQKRIAFNMPLLQLCMYVSMLLISWFGAKEIVASGNISGTGLTTGELSSLVTYLMQILMNLMMFSMVFVMIITSRASAERIVEVLDEVSDIQNGEHPVYTVEDGSIEFKDVVFTYSRKSEKPVLDHINLRIETGETVGIIGGTGSAKSSLVQLIPRLYDTTEGEVFVGGLNVKDYDVESLRNDVAMVLQKNVLFSGSIAENLRWGNPNATQAEIEHACQLAQADGFIKEFPDQYETHIEQGGTNVSGGQRQRLCIARALLKQPKILILDDSTSAVDTKTDQSIRQAFKNEIPNTTKIIIAQRVASVQEADKIIVMDDGRISAIGDHESLLATNMIYREVYESQNRGGIIHE